MYSLLWIIVMVAAVIVEAASFHLLSIWFAVGALAAVIASSLGAGIAVQTVVFLTVSVGLLAATRPLLKKLMPGGYIPTNGELDLGRKAVVIEKIDGSTGTGRVRLDGVDWGAVSADGAVISEGTTVVVTAKGAAHLTVKADAKAPQV